MSLRILLVCAKYSAIFAFVIWVWETRPLDQQGLLFWCVWTVALINGSFLFFKYNKRNHDPQ